MTDTPSQQNATRRQRTVDFIKRAYFRETTGGFVYRAPNPWLVGHADHYLVSAAQQDEIVAILSSPSLIPASRPRPTPALIIGRFVVGLALMLVLPTVLWPNTPAIATVVFMLELSLFFLVGWHLSAQRRLTLLQPILASASKTNERLLPWTLRSALSPQKKATPRQMVIAGIINTALFVLFTPTAISSWQRHGLSLIDPFWLLGVVPIYFGIIAAINFYWALKKQDSAAPMQISARLGIGLILLVSAVLSLSLGNHLYRGFHDVAAMDRLGWQYRDGVGVPRDYAKAKVWFEKAAAAGNGAAMSNLGSLYQNGQGVPQDFARAKLWFEKAAAAGEYAAMYKLGALYQNGQGAAQDNVRARELYENSAAGGLGVSMYQLGQMYENGSGVTKDFVQSKAWYEKAAAAGYPPAMNQLGGFYAAGSGVPRDQVLARSWFEKAAAAGDPNGIGNIAAALSNTLGGPADYPRAAVLLLRSAKLNVTSRREQLLGSMDKWPSAMHIEVKRELTRLGHYAGPIDEQWDDNVRAAVRAYLNATG